MKPHRRDADAPHTVPVGGKPQKNDTERRKYATAKALAMERDFFRVMERDFSRAMERDISRVMERDFSPKTSMFQEMASVKSPTILDVFFLLPPACLDSHLNRSLGCPTRFETARGLVGCRETRSARPRPAGFAKSRGGQEAWLPNCQSRRDRRGCATLAWVWSWRAASAGSRCWDIGSI